MRHKNQTNDFIKDCLAVSYVKLLYEKPKEEISITDICSKAGFGRTTYYRHFSTDKNDLILYIGKRKWEEYKQNHPEEVLKDEGFELITHCYNNRKFMLMLKKQNMAELLFRILFDIYGVKETENPVLRYGKDLFVGMYFGVIYDWILMGCADTPLEVKNKIKQGFALAMKNEEVKKNN